MLVTHSIIFDQNILNDSIDDYVRLNYEHGRRDDLSYYIIAKHLIKYLKDHPESKVCENLSTMAILYKLKDMCYIHARTMNNNEISEFIANKKLELELTDNRLTLKNTSFFEVWFYIDLILEQFERRQERVEYGYNRTNN